MPVQQEIKSQLAKLLATEDITVEHKQVQTASFNVDSRVLILPLWEKASNDVYDMLVGHEVGHALFTPNEWDWLDEGIPAGVVNVVEDARIEKLMKRKYMGIAKSFFKGYTELHQDNFFEINVDKVDQMNLADRANLYFKIGTFLDLTFTSEEQEIIDLIKNCETFKDTLSAAKALHLFCKEEIQKQKEALESQEGGEDEISPNELSEITKGSGNSISDDSDDNQFTTPSPDDNSDVESGDSDGTGTYGMDPSDDSIDDLIRFLKMKDFRKMRQWVANNMDTDSSAIFRSVYDKMSDKLQPQSIPQLVLILADYQYKNAFVADHELNTVACLTEVMAGVKFK